MRQLHAFLRCIHIRNTTEMWTEMSFFAQLHQAEIKPLNEILGIGYEESSFDENTDKIMDEHAQKILQEQKMLRKMHG